MGESEIVVSEIAVGGEREHEARSVATGFSWPECPRWHNGRMWFTDMYTGTLRVVDESGNVTVTIDASGRADAAGAPIALGGYGWLPDGRLIVVSMFERLLLVHDGPDSTSLSVYADLTGVAPFPINDMVVAADGSAYVTQLGFDYFAGGDPVPSPIILVDSTGHATEMNSARPLLGANGIAISADGRQVYTAEAFANRIVVMDRSNDGELSGSRDFVECPSLPDGISLDDEGGVWVAMPGSGRVVRFSGEGIATDSVLIPLQQGLGSACLLGGPGRSTLYVTVGTAVEDQAESVLNNAGSIWSVDVGYSGGATRP